MKRVVFTICILSVIHPLYAQVISETVAKKLVASVIPLHPGQKINTGDSAVIRAAYIDAPTKLQFINLQQFYKGIRVFNGVQTAVFRGDSLQSSVTTFIQSINTKAPGAVPAITAADALYKTAAQLELPFPGQLVLVADHYAAEKKMIYAAPVIAKQNIETELVWIPDISGKVHLAWDVSIDILGSSDYWSVRIDAHTGEVINKNNRTLDHYVPGKVTGIPVVKSKASTSAQVPSYSVFPTSAPPPTVASASYNVIPYPGDNRFTGKIAVETDPWKKAGTTNNATTNGWHFDGTNNYNYTRGNNVFVYDNTLARPDTSSTSGSTLTFFNTPDFTQDPTVNVNRRFATDNMFYWINIMHDVSYQYGFTEAAGNFQTDNIGRGGTGNDAVLAEVQNPRGPNEGQFTFSRDGTPGRLQMYLLAPTNVNILHVGTPASIAGGYISAESDFSTANHLAQTGTVTGTLVLYKDSTGSSSGCLPAVNNISGKIVLMFPTSACAYTIAVKNAQNAGAIGVITVRNIAGDPVNMGGADNSITIPAIMISNTDGAAINAQLSVNQAVSVSLVPAPQFDADLDNSVICHEYTHGISTRLTGGIAGNGSCLTNGEQGGEGWSDYMGLMMTTDWSKALLTDGALARQIADYSDTQLPGKQSPSEYTYSTDMSLSPYTYADLSVSQEIHRTGAVWCAALWDMTWNIIQQEGNFTADIYNAGGSGGNVKALQLIILGMKLQPCEPGFLDARDAILKADSILYGYAHQCAIWKAFARRGMGFSAKEGFSFIAGDETPAYDQIGLVIPTISIVQNPLTSVCPGGVLSFTVTSTTNSGTSPQYQWQKNNTNVTGATSATYTTGNLNTINNGDTYKCILTSSIDCSAKPSSNPIVVALKPLPVPSITATTPFFFCTGDSVVMTSGAPTGNQWYVNNVPTVVSVNQTLTAKISGNYTDTVTGSNGCKAGLTVVVISYAVPSTPIISTSGSTALCPGSSVLLTSNAAFLNQWYKNGVLIKDSVNSSFTANAAGTYTDTVSNSIGCKTGSATITVTVGVPAVPAITAATSTVFCGGDSVILTSSAATGNQWYKDGTAISNATGIKDTVKAGGSYTVKATNNGGCSATSAATIVTVNASPAIVITASGPLSFCAGSTVVLVSSSAAGYTYQWRKDGAAISGATSVNYSVSASGTYSVTVTNTAGCKTISADSIVTVTAFPAVPVISPAGSVGICAGSSTVLTSSAATGNQWYNNGAPISGAISPTYAATQAGNYAVTATSNSCSSARSVAVSATVNSIPLTPVISQNGDTLVSSAATGNQWYLNGNPIAGAVNQKYKILAGGSYTVRVTGTNGCQSPLSAALSVTVTAIAPVVLNSKDWIVFPNPVTQGILVIKRNGILSGRVTAQLLTADGRIADEKILSTNNQWNISRMASGTYYLRIIEKTKTALYQFIKQ